MTARVASTSSGTRPVEEVFAMLTSEAWAATKAERLRDGTRLVERHEQPDGGVRFAVSRELPAGVPGFLERFLPRDGRVVQRDDWQPAGADGVRRGTWTVEIPGAPARLGGTMRLEPMGGGSSYTIEGEVKVSVPLVGGRAESFIADMVGRLAAKEAELLRSTLEG